MENASKALIIAGAILVAILLISIGVIIINAINPMTERARGTSETQAISAFNAQFTPYEGPGKTAAQIRSLTSVVNASNASNAEQVVISGNSDLKTNTKYNVSLSYKNGYVSAITISQ